MILEENKVINGLWIGNSLTKMELLTLKSFVKHGHIFQLWTYTNLSKQVPDGVICRDANEIIPESEIFYRKYADPKFGIGKGSVATPFSDLFRYKLLYEQGGWWVDMDITCLKQFDFASPYYFRAHHELAVIGNVMKCPKNSEVMKLAYEKTLATCTTDTKDWLLPNKILNEAIEKFGLTSFIYTGHSNIDMWSETSKFIDAIIPIPADYYFLHWLNEEWRARGIGKFFIYEGNTLSELLKMNGIHIYRRPLWEKKLNIQISVSSLILFVFAFAILFYFGWECYWFSKVGLAFIKWHTHLAVPLLLCSFTFILLLFLKKRVKYILYNFQRILFPIVSVYFTLFCLEFILVITGINKTRNEKEGGWYFSYYFDKNNIYHTWQKNCSHLLKSAEFCHFRNANSLGFSDIEWIHTLESDSTIRILCLGDSFTEGDGAPKDSSYPKLLEKLLKKNRRNYEVMNAGTCGSDPFFNYMAYKDLLSQYQPQVVLQELSTHDILADYMHRGGLERFGNKELISTKNIWWEPIYALSYTSRVFFNFFGLADKIANSYKYDDIDSKKMNEDFRNLFNAYEQLTQKNGAKLVVVLLPMKHETANGEYDFKLPVPDGISKIDLLKHYQNKFHINNQNYQQYYWVEDAHHNSKGYNLMADGVYDTLKNL